MTTFHSRTDLLAQGLTDTEIRGMVARGELDRMSIGRYLTGPIDDLTPEQHHALRTHVELSRFTSPHVMASHASAAVLHGLPVIDLPLNSVEVIRHGRTGGRKSKRCHVRAGRVHDADRMVIGATPVTSVARTLIDLARTAPMTTTVAAADHALRRRLLTPNQVKATMDRIGSGPGLPHIRRVLRMADGRSESPGESKLHLWAHLAGFTTLELQVEVFATDKQLVGRADGGLLEHGILLEFDGKEKYSKYRKPGEHVSDAVMREKKRERRLRDLGWEVVRFDWADLSNRAEIEQRIRDEIRRCEHRPPPHGSVLVADPLRIVC